MNPTTQKERFNTRLTKIMYVKNMTKRELASRTGASVFTVHAWSRGRFKPKIGYLKAISYALDVSIKDLLDGVDY